MDKKRPEERAPIHTEAASDAFSDTNTIFRIRTRFSALSKTNQKIANFLLNNIGLLNSTTITQLAGHLKVSPSTITRFCQTFGFTGFPELKYHIINNSSPFILMDQQIQPNEPISVIKNKICSTYLQVVNETIALIDDQVLSLAAYRISNAERLYFFSQGGSGASAQFGQISLMQIGFPCQCYNDMTISKLAASDLTSKDVAIAISYSGSAKVPVDALRIAQQKNATTIAITGFSNSPLLRFANIQFCYNAKIDDDMRLMHLARICEIGIISLLQGCVLSLNYERVHKQMSVLKSALTEGRY